MDPIVLRKIARSECGLGCLRCRVRTVESTSVKKPLGRSIAPAGKASKSAGMVSRTRRATGRPQPGGPARCSSSVGDSPNSNRGIVTTRRRRFETADGTSSGGLRRTGARALRRSRRPLNRPGRRGGRPGTALVPGWRPAMMILWDLRAGETRCPRRGVLPADQPVGTGPCRGCGSAIHDRTTISPLTRPACAMPGRGPRKNSVRGSSLADRRSNSSESRACAGRSTVCGRAPLQSAEHGGADGRWSIGRRGKTKPKRDESGDADRGKPAWWFLRTSRHLRAL